MKFDEFLPILNWWNDRTETEFSWRVAIEELEENGYNLDIKNPSKYQNEILRKPEEIINSMDNTEKSIAKLILKLRSIIDEGIEIE